MLGGGRGEEGSLSRVSEMKEGRAQCRFELDTEGHGEREMQNPMMGCQLQIQNEVDV